jgi:2-haloacid dehalogenase
MTSYDWLILDADGTLFDFHRAEAAALKLTPDQLHIRVPPDIETSYHAINASLWQDFEAGHVQARDIRTQRFKRLFQRLDIKGDPDVFSEAFLANLVQETRFYDGAEALLSKLRDRVGMVLLTNGFADVQHARIARLGLQETFDHVLISEEIGATKPDRAAFDVAFEKMGHPAKERVLIVGDSLSSDIRGGEDYGIDTCWFNPDRRPNPTTVAPTYEIRQLEALPPLVLEERKA